MSLVYRSLETAEDILAREQVALRDEIRRDKVSYSAVSSAVEYVLEEHGYSHPLVEELTQGLLGLEDDLRRNHYRLAKLV